VTHLRRALRAGSPSRTRPSCPKWLLPQTNMWPLLVKAALCASPAASCTTGSAQSPSTRVGVCLLQRTASQQGAHSLTVTSQYAVAEWRSRHHHRRFGALRDMLSTCHASTLGLKWIFCFPEGLDCCCQCQ
jgi:hypothetical protein